MPGHCSEFVHRRRVAFHETDMAGILHFAVYTIYMEETEHAFLRSLGTSVDWRREPPDELAGSDAPEERDALEERLGFPRLSVRCEYLRPLRFEDEVVIELRVVRLGRSSITYQFCMTLETDEVARGEVVTSCCRLRENGRLESVALPESLREQLAVSQKEKLVFGPRS